MAETNTSNNKFGGRPGKTSDMIEKVVHISRVAKVVKGGKRFSFSCVAVVGDGRGQVGVGLGKANEVPDAIRKACEKARKDMVKVPLAAGTIPHETLGRYGAARVVLKPAQAGTGIIAGGVVRAVAEAVGIANVLTKCIGTNNPHNVIKAAIDGLANLKTPERTKFLRSKDETK